MQEEVGGLKFQGVGKAHGNRWMMAMLVHILWVPTAPTPETCILHILHPTLAKESPITASLKQSVSQPEKYQCHVEV